MADGSLSSVVSSLVRAQMGATLPSAVTDEDLDRHVAELILKEAKKKAEQYDKQGIHAYLPQSVHLSTLPFPSVSIHPFQLILTCHLDKRAMSQKRTNAFSRPSFAIRTITTRASCARRRCRPPSCAWSGRRRSAPIAGCVRRRRLLRNVRGGARGVAGTTRARGIGDIESGAGSGTGTARTTRARTAGGRRNDGGRRTASGDRAIGTRTGGADAARARARTRRTRIGIRRGGSADGAPRRGAGVPVPEEQEATLRSGPARLFRRTWRTKTVIRGGGGGGIAQGVPTWTLRMPPTRTQYTKGARIDTATEHAHALARPRRPLVRRRCQRACVPGVGARPQGPPASSLLRLNSPNASLPIYAAATNSRGKGKQQRRRNRSTSVPTIPP